MNIVILGGGSAGWMTASILTVNHPEINITVIEDKKIPTIGVGEATTPYLMRFFESVGIKDEKEWMSACNATYKNGVLYDDWDHINSRFWHAFEVDENKYIYWNREREKEGLSNQDYWTSSMFTGHLAMRDSGKWLADKKGEIAIPYYHTKAWNGWPQHWAYNVDAGLFGEFLKEKVCSNIKYINDFTVSDIVRADNGDIIKLISSKGLSINGDLFIDCSGFHRYLIDKVAKQPFRTLEPYLTHDKACVIRYPYQDPEKEMKPRTRSKALGSGWVWDIPLYNKISSGYVYTSSYLSDEEAEQEMREDLGFDKTKGMDSFIIDIKTGYYPESWSNNVVAVGLSAGFIEPLESTLLLAIQVAGIRISKVLSGTMSKDKYNSMAVRALEDFLDYISVGYYLSHRNDTQFWRDRGKNTIISDRMMEWLNRCKYELVPPEDIRWFVPSSWISKLIAFNYYPEDDKTRYREVDALLAKNQMREVKNFDWHKLTSQKDFLDKHRY